MDNTQYGHLFAPITLGNTLFRNRIFASPTGCLGVDDFGAPTPEGIAFYERKAAGGAAAVTIGDCIVDSRTGHVTAYQLLMDAKRGLQALSCMADGIARHGAVASVELQHGGISAHLSYEKGEQLLGPVDMAIPDEHKINNDGQSVRVSPDGLRHIRAMTEEELIALAETFGRAAGLAKKCGFGMVMVHAGHGWGLSQFLSPSLNTRKDRWGGSFENRMRFPLAVIECVRKAVGPKFPIEVRISGSECTDTGYDIEEGIRIAKALDGKADLIHVSAGFHESVTATTIMIPSMFLEDGCNVKYAAEIKKHVKTPVATVGALVDPAYMEEILASGKADVVEVARALLSDPDMPRKARVGKTDAINTCMRCSACVSYNATRRNRACAINPEIGRELEIKYSVPKQTKKEVLVAGGGIAGMEAALTAAGLGHSVVLCEKGDALGGVLRCEADVPFKMRLHEYLDRQARRVREAGIDVRLGTEATEAFARQLGPDVIVAAVGSEAVRPDIPGIDGENVFDAEKVFIDPSLAKKSAVILGGGLVGCELAIFLKERGTDVTILEMLPELNHGGNVVHMIAVNWRLEQLEIPLILNTRALEINSEGVVGEGPGGMQLYKGEAVIIAAGRRPSWVQAEQLRGCAPEFYQVGDCLSAGNIMSATSSAFFAARDIGR
jgi:2,4-dienoyl-CoA reductase-like NADH-dependent reductase (Old Yellow Enzyme family)/thioredoxin reductase